MADITPMQINYVPRIQSQYELDIVETCLKEFSQLQLQRNTFATQWEEAAELIDPNSRNTFMFGTFNWQGEKKTHRQIDASGMLALERFTAISDSLMTPRNMTWQVMEHPDPYVMKQRGVRIYYEQLTRALFDIRYDIRGGFTGQNSANFRNLGAYGNHTMLIDEFDDTLRQFGPGLRYQSIPLGQMFFKCNHQNVVDGFVRWFRLTPRQMVQKFGMERFPETLRPALEQRSENRYQILHWVCPRTDFEYGRWDEKGKPYASYYVSLEGRSLLQEGGYRTMPAPCSRYMQSSGEDYGRGPAQMVLPALKTLNAQKRTFLTQGHRASNPVLLTHDDGLVDASLRPGAMNKGGVNADGKELVKILPTGSIQWNEKMMDMERGLIDDAFLVRLFQILEKTPQMTATEVIERTNEKGILIAPTMGRQYDEYIGPMTHRELDLASYLNLLPKAPAVLMEASGSSRVQYKVKATSPLAKAQHAQQASGFMRTLDAAKEVVAITQDPAPLDVFDFDTALPAIADIQSVPASWMSSKKKIEDTRKGRAQAQQQKAAIDALPAQAAMVKAKAVVAKNNPQGADQQQPGNPMGGQ